MMTMMTATWYALRRFPSERDQGLRMIRMTCLFQPEQSLCRQFLPLL